MRLGSKLIFVLWFLTAIYVALAMVNYSILTVFSTLCLFLVVAIFTGVQINKENKMKKAFEEAQTRTLVLGEELLTTRNDLSIQKQKNIRLEEANKVLKEGGDS